jgi:K(+)-stimulated pyrophosphate-energized sodium pump
LSQYDAEGNYVGGSIEKVSKDVRVEIIKTDETAKATVTTTLNGQTETQTFEGTEAEVKAKIDALK